ncbi:MAG TPA: hypothetical protein VFS00_12470 [Polyangiaceae bacterium]|nr:hypothetical protein [Polyangiaceae bacterium]
MDRDRRALVAGLLGLGTGGLAGCGGAKQVSLAEGPRQYVPFDYDQVLKRWTRTESLVALSELDDLLTVTSTFESWDFRWAYVVRYAADYRLTIDQRKRLLESTLSDARAKHQFYIALYGPNRRWNDISRKNSAWIVRLIDDKGNETAPEEIVAIAKPGAIERTYFPYTTIFRQAFRIRFPVLLADGRRTVASDAHWFGLRFAGAQGNQDLVWQLASNDADRSAIAPDLIRGG